MCTDAECIGFDFNQVFVNSPNIFINGISFKITEIDFSDSPYNTLLDDVFILIDASAGNVDVDVVKHPENLNQTYKFKRIDNTSNTVTIHPPAGYTIEGSAAYSLLRNNDVVDVVLNEPATNYVVSNDKVDRVLTTKGDILVHNGTKIVRMPAGTNGQVLLASSSAPNGLIWASLGSITSKTTYTLFNYEAVTTTVQYVTIACFPWFASEHGAYSGGKVIFRSMYSNRSLNIRLYDETHAVAIGELLNINTSGTHSFPIVNPAGDAKLLLQIGTESQGGFKHRVFGALLEFGN